MSRNPHTAPIHQTESVRAAFEAHYRKLIAEGKLQGLDESSFKRTPSGNYDHLYIGAYWHGWNASASTEAVSERVPPLAIVDEMLDRLETLTDVPDGQEMLECQAAMPRIREVIAGIKEVALADDRVVSSDYRKILLTMIEVADQRGIVMRMADADALYLAAVHQDEKNNSSRDPLDTPIPCDLADGAVTLQKGVPLRAVLSRIQYLSGLCRANLGKAYQYDIEHPNDGLNGYGVSTQTHPAIPLPNGWKLDRGGDDIRLSNKDGKWCAFSAEDPSPRSQLTLQFLGDVLDAVDPCQRINLENCA